jgi:hypothetical protein
MCTDCIVRTSVGYVCKECSHRAEEKFFAAANTDYALQAAACFVVMGVICAVFTQVPFVSTYLSILLGPIAGGLAGEAAMRITGRRRGRYTDRIGTAAAGIGGLVGRFAVTISLYQEATQGMSSFFVTQYDQMYGSLPSQILHQLLLDPWFLVFLGLALAGAYARLRGRI